MQRTIGYVFDFMRVITDINYQRVIRETAPKEQDKKILKTIKLNYIKIKKHKKLPIVANIILKSF